MMGAKKHKCEVWAQLLLSREDCDHIHDFFVRTIGVKSRFVVKNMHLTLYHARRVIPGLVASSECARVVLGTNETRFIVMAPGGENPRENLDPAKRKVGIRIHRQSPARLKILDYRERLTRMETIKVLGKRAPSTRTRNAFGARHFQPHMTILWPGSGIDRDLTKIGVLFRKTIKKLIFDRFSIEIVDLTNTKGG